MSPPPSPLRIGLVVDGAAPPSWQARLARELAAQPGVELAALVVRRSPAGTGDGLPPLHALYRAVDRRLHRGWQGWRSRSRLAQWPAVARIEVEPGRGHDGSARLSEAEIEALRAARLDLLLELDGEHLGDGCAATARFGRWALRVGEVEGAGGLAEQIGDRPTITLALHVTPPAAGAPRVVAATTRLPTHHYSLARSLAGLHGSLAGFVLQALAALQHQGALPAAPAPDDAGAAHLPSAHEVARALVRYGVRVGIKTAQWSLFDIYHWTLAIAPRRRGQPIPELLTRGAFHAVPQPADRFYADPMLFEHVGATWLLFEEFRYARGRGTLAACRLDADGVPGAPRTILERDYHLSYPFVFRSGDDIYLVPESGEDRTIQLFRCLEFPDRWEREAVLLAGRGAYDSTLVEHQGRWWMFTALSPLEGPGELALHLYFADHPRGPFAPHPLNPIVTDVTRVRPGGRLFSMDGSLVRPAQDSAGRYGRALSFQRIDRMTPDDYAERTVAHVAPEDTGWARRALGIHTVDATDTLCVADACAWQFRGRRWLDRLAAFDLGRSA